MNPTPAAACLLALALVAALPRVFFRPGRLNPRWWLTAAPFLLASLALLAGLIGWATPLLSPGGTPSTLTGWAALALAMGGAALIAFTLGSHRAPVSLWHQEDDAPVELVTWGAYARVRHPFYAAFLLILAGAALALPHPATLVALATGLVQLDRTAAREERRLLASELGDTYRAYMARSGRFWPRGPRRCLASGHGPHVGAGRGADAPPLSRS